MSISRHKQGAAIEVKAAGRGGRNASWSVMLGYVIEMRGELPRRGGRGETKAAFCNGHHGGPDLVGKIGYHSITQACESLSACTSRRSVTVPRNTNVRQPRAVVALSAGRV